MRIRAVDDSTPESAPEYGFPAIPAPDPAIFQSGIGTSSGAGSSAGVGSKGGFSSSEWALFYLITNQNELYSAKITIL